MEQVMSTKAEIPLARTNRNPEVEEVLGALSMLLNTAAGFQALAIGPALLLVSGIRNSWDMIVYFALRDRGPE